MSKMPAMVYSLVAPVLGFVIAATTSGEVTVEPRCRLCFSANSFEINSSVSVPGSLPSMGNGKSSVSVGAGVYRTFAEFSPVPSLPCPSYMTQVR